MTKTGRQRKSYSVAKPRPRSPRFSAGMTIPSADRLKESPTIPPSRLPNDRNGFTFVIGFNPFPIDALKLLAVAATGLSPPSPAALAQ